MIDSFDKEVLRNLRSDMEALLAKYGASVNVDFTVGNMRYSAAEVDMKIKAVVKGAVTRTDENLQRMMAFYGLVEQKNGKRLVRYDSRKHKYPFIYEFGGKLFKTTEVGAKALFAA